MIKKYEKAIKHGCDYLASFNDLNPIIIQAYWHRYMKYAGFDVIVQVNDTEDQFIICPKQDNLPVHIWRKK